MSKARKKRAPVAPVAIESASPLLEQIEAFFDRWAIVLVLVLSLVATIRIVSTYTVFNHTYDEPAHIACGMQWLDQHIYQYEHQHPPLTRVMVALGPYLDGAHSNHQEEMFDEGTSILYSGNQYDRRLSLSRAGNLPFFWLALWMVFIWGRQTLGSPCAVLAVFIFTMIPTVLAHAGLSTTDMGVTACFAAASYALARLAQDPGPKTAAWLGIAGGLMILSKFSALVFYPAAVGFALLAWIYSRRPAISELMRLFVRRLPWLGLAALLSFLIVWAGYRFSFSKTVWFPFAMPFPELYSGIKQVVDHNQRGHLSYLLGELRIDGWWAFFPVLLAVKLPLAMLGLCVIGIWRRPERSAHDWPFAVLVAIPAGILAVALASRINIGLRHILPAFPFLAMIAASGAFWLLRRGLNINGRSGPARLQ